MPGDTRNIRINVDIDGDNRALPPIVKGLGDTAKSADKAGASLKGMGDDAKSLNAQIAESNKHIVELRKNLVEAGNDKGIRKALRGEESWLRELKKIQSAELPDVGGGRLMRSPALIGGVVGLAAAAAVPVGALIAGAVAGTIGTAGIAGGIAMASKDSRVKSAAADFGRDISEEFFSGGGAFVGPIQRSLSGLKDAFHDMQLGEAFAKMAPHVETIAKGLGDFGRNIMPGLNKAFDRMGPFAAAAGHGIAEMGKALGIFMDRVTASEGTITGLNFLFKAISATIIGTGNVINALADAFDGLVKYAAAFTGVLEDIPGIGGMWDQWNDFLEGLLNRWPAAAGAVRAGSAVIVSSNEETTKTWIELEEQIRAATRAQDAYFNSAMAVPAAQDALEASFDNFNESLQENGRNFDASTEKGRANRDALRDMISAAQELRTAQIEQGQATSDVNRKYQENIAKIEQIAAEAGITKEALQAMAGNYNINIYTNKVTTIKTFTDADAREARQTRAAGGPVLAGVPYVINERGYETVTFPAGGTVHPANLTPMAGAGGVPVNVYGGGFVEQWWSWFREEMASRGYRLVAVNERL